MAVLLWTAAVAAWASPVTDLTVSTAGYLGGDGDDIGNAVAIQSDKTIVLGGRFSALPPADASHSLLDADPTAGGAVLRLLSDGKTIRPITRLGAVVDDLDIDPSDDAIVATGDFGLAKLASDGSSVLWRKPIADFDDAGDASALFGNGRRVAVGLDGTIAAQFNGWYFIFDADGAEISRRLIVRDENDKDANPDGVGGYNHRVEDIAIDSGNRLVFSAGFSQRSGDFQSAFLIAFSYARKDGDGRDRKVWKNYNWWDSIAKSTGLTADTKGVRVAMGRDGRLYFTGYADGGNNIFTRNPTDLSLEANNIKIDRFNDGAGAGSGRFAYFLKADPATGDMDRGQFQYSSAGVNNAKSFTIYAVSGDPFGNVLIGGRSADAMPNRAELKINGVSIGERVADENSFLHLSPDLTERTIAACWTGVDGADESRITAVDSAHGVTVVLGETQGTIMTVAPLDGSKNAGVDVFFSVWSGAALQIPGDLNCNGGRDLGDAVAMLKILAGMDPPASDCSALIGDLDESGRLDLGDAAAILQRVAD